MIKFKLFCLSILCNKLFTCMLLCQALGIQKSEQGVCLTLNRRSYSVHVGLQDKGSAYLYWLVVFLIHIPYSYPNHQILWDDEAQTRVTAYILVSGANNTFIKLWRHPPTNYELRITYRIFDLKNKLQLNVSITSFET